MARRMSVTIVVVLLGAVSPAVAQAQHPFAARSVWARHALVSHSARRSVVLTRGAWRSSARSGRSWHTDTTPGPTIAVRGTGHGCGFTMFPAADWIQYVESYSADGTTLYNDVTWCAQNQGPGTPQTHTEAQGDSCDNPGGQSVTDSPNEEATFTDGEAILICTIPDDNGSGGSNGEFAPYTFYQQAFTCQATVGVGATDSTPDNIKNKDSIEYYERYTDFDGNSVAGITTACLGQLPAGTVIDPNATVTHLVGCSEFNPFGAGYVQGYGITMTSPDGQYEEDCSVPNYSVGAPPA